MTYSAAQQGPTIVVDKSTERGQKDDMNKQSPHLSDADATYQKLEELIVLTELKPGVLYSEKQLAELVGYGRTPVREAVQRLAIEGLVAIQQRKGIQITGVDPDWKSLTEHRLPAIQLVAGQSSLLPLRSRSFDLALAS